MLILGTNSIKDTGYTVANSCRFQDSDSAEMSRAIASTGSNTTWTVSAWVKRVELGQSSPIFGTGDGGANNDARMVFFDAADAIECSYYNSGYTYEVTTNRVFRDISAWYHICILFDSTQGTAANRIKIYVNGTQETSFATSSYPGESAAFNFGNTSYTHYVNDMGGRNIRGSHYIAELVYIDGTASAVTNFGEFDSDSPTIWKPIDVSGLSVGTNGVYLDFEASDNLGNAVDGGTDFTEAGLDAQNQATDTPTNNFATLNPLLTGGTAPTMSEGNLKIAMGSAAWSGQRPSTIVVNKGKWYVECFIHTLSSANQYSIFGIQGVDDLNANPSVLAISAAQGLAMALDNRADQTLIQGNDATILDPNIDPTDNDIVGMALDLDNGKVYFHLNGTYTNSGDPSSGATGTGATDVPTADIDYFITLQTYSSAVVSINFGGTSVSAISSGNADGNGYGNMEFSVPANYYCLNTANLAEFG